MILRQEITRDPQDVGYSQMTHEEMVKLLNHKQFYQTEMMADKQAELQESFFDNILYVTKSVQVNSTDFTFPANLFGLKIAHQVKRSRAELLFGPDTVVSEQDIRLALLS
jgi:hypothetical protein